MYVSWRGVNYGENEEVFSVTETGFYTFDFYMYNQDGIGNYNFKVTEEDGTDVKYYPSKDAIQKELPDYVQLTNDIPVGGRGHHGMKYGYKGSETDQITLSKIKASLTDRDGSEKLDMTLEGLVEGATLTYTKVDKDGHKTLGTAVADDKGMITVKGEHGDNIVDYTDLVLTLPEGVDKSKLDVKMTVTATEKGIDQGIDTVFDFVVNVLDPSREVVSTANDDLISTGTTGNDSLIYGLLKNADQSNGKAGHGTDTWVDFGVGKPATDSNADLIKFAKGFFEGLNNSDVTGKNIDFDQVKKFITVEYNAETETATLSVDRDGDRGRYESEVLLHLTNQSTKLTLEDLLANQQIIIG